MNKEELTRALKYTEKKHRNDTVDTFGTDISIMCADVLKVLKNCIEIPDNVTNGDVVKLMFPDAEIQPIMGYFVKDLLLGYRVYLGGRSQDYLLDWWNTPYKKEVEE